MEKTLTIDGREVRFKATAATMIRYKAEFGREYIADMSAMERFAKEPDMESLDLTPFYRVVWVLAKTADPDIPDMMTWLDGFSEFPVVSIFADLKELVALNMRVDRKNG